MDGRKRASGRCCFEKIIEHQLNKKALLLTSEAFFYVFSCDRQKKIDLTSKIWYFV